MQDVSSTPTRRDFICVSAGAFVAVGSGAALWPLIHQMNPHPGTPPPERCTVDLAPIEPGQAVTVAWRGQPVFVRHRTREEIERARGVRLGGLKDPYARNALLPARAPAHDENRTLAEHPEWLVVIGLCTHMNCVLMASDRALRDADNEAWFCRCHAARFDLAGRVQSGPAGTNLPVPPYRFVTPGKIEIGEA
ncbi:MAG: ubiquinol-cytochrome c reductase iron-sulfur subunit [Hyphomicrobiaceae bacterium]